MGYCGRGKAKVFPYLAYAFLYFSVCAARTLRRAASQTHEDDKAMRIR
jgi:hypothetical protein